MIFQFHHFCDQYIILFAIRNLTSSSFFVKKKEVKLIKNLDVCKRHKDNLLWERLYVAFYWAPLGCGFICVLFCSRRDANYNAKSINNHNHDHNEHTTLTWSEETSRELRLWNRWRNGGDAKKNYWNKRKSIKRLKILLAVTFTWNSFLNTASMRLAAKKRAKKKYCINTWCVWISTIIIRLWCLNASTSHRLHSLTYVYVCNLSLDILVSVCRWSNRHCNIQFQMAVLSSLQHYFHLIAICHLPDAKPQTQQMIPRISQCLLNCAIHCIRAVKTTKCRIYSFNCYFVREGMYCSAPFCTEFSKFQ